MPATMRQRLLTLISVLSLLLLILTAALWVCNYLRYYILVWGKTDPVSEFSPIDLGGGKWIIRAPVQDVRYIATDRGRIIIGRSRVAHPLHGHDWWNAQGLEHHTETTSGQWVPRQKSILSFGSHADGSPAAGLLGSANAGPLWSLAALPAVVQLWWMRRWLRRRRLRRHPELCPACGYDLTGNVSGRCPECGRPTQLDPRTI